MAFNAGRKNPHPEERSIGPRLEGRTIDPQLSVFQRLGGERGALAECLHLGPGDFGMERQPKPQSVPAMTFSLPTRLAKRWMRCDTSSGCSTTSVEWVTTPGITILPAGSFTVSHTAYSCSCRAFAASNKYACAFTLSMMSTRCFISRSW